MNLCYSSEEMEIFEESISEAAAPEESVRAQNGGEGERGGVADVITVDRTRCPVGESVHISWEMRSRALHERDFIGMFEVYGEEAEGGDASAQVTMDRLMAARTRGDSSASGGHLQWLLEGELFDNCK